MVYPYISVQPCHTPPSHHSHAAARNLDHWLNQEVRCQKYKEILLWVAETSNNHLNLAPLQREGKLEIFTLANCFLMAPVLSCSCTIQDHAKLTQRYIFLFFIFPQNTNITRTHTQPVASPAKAQGFPFAREFRFMHAKMVCSAVFSYCLLWETSRYDECVEMQSRSPYKKKLVCEVVLS